MDVRVEGNRAMESAWTNALLTSSEWKREAEGLLYCEAHNVSYAHRVVNRDDDNYCAVPDGGADAVLLAGLAIALACVLRGRLSAVWLLLAGMATQVLVYGVNTWHLGNATVLWTSARPPEVFYFVFLPALMFESASNLDAFLFRKVLVKVLVFAVALVLVQTGLTAFSLVYLLDLKSYGWTIEHGLLIGTTLSMTDAVAVTSILATTDAPEELGVVLEGESLLNDASGFVLFSMFLKYATDNIPFSAGFVFTQALWDMLILGIGGVLLGVFFGLALIISLHYMRRAGLDREPEIAMSVAIAYLCFYVAQGPAGLSGPVAVVTTGLMVNAKGKADLSPAVQDLWQRFWGLLAFIANGMIFFFAGISAMNFILFAGQNKDFDKTLSIAYLPLIYVLLFALRFLCICPIWLTSRLTAENPKSAMTMKDVVFLTFTALRGACSLIQENEVVLQPSIPESVKLQMVVWTAGFTLMTILINVPLLPWLFKLTGHSSRAAGQAYLHTKAIESLQKFTSETVESMVNLEVLKKADWTYVLECVLPGVADKTPEPLPAAPSDEESLSSPLLNTPPTVQSEDQKLKQPSNSFRRFTDLLFRQPSEAKAHYLLLCEEAEQLSPGKVAPGEELYKSNVEAIQQAMDIARQVSLQKLEAEGSMTMPTCYHSTPEDAFLAKNLSKGSNMYGFSHMKDEAYNPHLDEMRARLVAGLKHYMYQKRAEGFLSSNGLRWLKYGTDKQLQSGGELAMWTYIESQISGGKLVWLASTLDQLIRKTFQPALKFKPLRWLVRRTTRPLLAVLNNKHLLSEEIASDYLMALQHGNHNHWLKEVPELVKEVEKEVSRLRTYLEYAELESPERTKAIHSYRAIIAVLTQQLTFVEELAHGGMIKEAEKEQICAPIASKLQATSAQGPNWKVAGLLGRLKAIPAFGRFSSEWLFKVLIPKGQLKTFESGKLLLDGTTHDSAGCGLSIVLTGFVRNDWDDPSMRQIYKSGVCFEGLISTLTARQPFLTKKIYSEGALNRGTTIFHLSQSVIEEFKQKATEGDIQMVQLLADLYRLAAMEVVHLMQDEIDCALQHSLIFRPSSELWKRAAKALLRNKSLCRKKPATGSDSRNGPDFSLGQSIISMLEGASVLNMLPNQRAIAQNHIVLLQGSITMVRDQRHAEGTAVIPMTYSTKKDPIEIEAGPSGAMVVICRALGNGGFFHSSLLPLPRGAFSYVAWSLHEKGL